MEPQLEIGRRRAIEGRPRASSIASNNQLTAGQPSGCPGRIHLRVDQGWTSQIAGIFLSALRRAADGMPTAVVLMSLVVAEEASGQVIDRDFPVSLPGYEGDLTLPMQETDPRVSRSQGVEIGDFDLQPSLDESLGFNSDPLGNASGGSSLLETNAGVSLSSNWKRDALDAILNVDDQQYFDKPTATETNWMTGLGGSLDFLGSRWDLGYTHLAENLGPQQLGTAGVTAPVPYSDDDVRFEDNLVFGRSRLVPTIDYSTFSFGQAAGPFATNYAALNRQSVAGTLTGLYELSRARSVVVLFRDTSTRYATAPVGVPSNDFNDLLGLTGVEFEADALVRLRALIGAEARTFASPQQPSVVTPSAELDVVWQPTRLTQVDVSLRRRLDDAATASTGSTTITEGRIEIDHALRRNVELSAFADVGTSNYTAQALGPNVNQTEQNFGTDVDWTVSRHVELRLAYSYLYNNYSNNVIATTAFFPVSNVANIVTLGLRISE